MARERWFYAHDEVRHGPHRFPELVDALLALPEARTRLVWSRELETWTRAGRVPRLSEELARHQPAPAAPRPASPSPSPSRTAPLTRPAPPPRAPVQAGLSRPALFAGAALLVAVAAGALYLGLGGAPETTARVETTATGDGATAGPPETPAAAPPGGPGSVPAAAGGDAVALVGWADSESEVPAAEIGRLKGVAAWEADELTVTLYNGSGWRITEILVRTSILEGEQFVDSALLHPLVPRQDVDANVAPILERVAPDRRRPSVNPDDTRPFSGKAGPKPRAYRWRIEAARGHAPIRR